MVELRYESGETVPGFERGNCIHMNIDGLEIPLRWSGNPKSPAPGVKVYLRFYFRDSTIYAFGSK